MTKHNLKESLPNNGEGNYEGVFEQEREQRANESNTQSRLDASPISGDAERYGRSGKFLFCD